MHHLSMTNSIPQRFTAGVPCFTLLFITTAWLVHCSPRASAAGETAASIQAELSSSASSEKQALSKDVVPRPSDRQRHDPRRRALAGLRAALDRARAARPNEHLTTGPVDANVLVGMNRGAIVRALGQPGRCQMALQTICDPDTRPVQCRQEMRAQPAPCTSGTDLFYSFYHLPQGWLGGGPELLLQFHGGRCVSAEWRFTQ